MLNDFKQERLNESRKFAEEGGTLLCYPKESQDWIKQDCFHQDKYYIENIMDDEFIELRKKEVLGQSLSVFEYLCLYSRFMDCRRLDESYYFVNDTSLKLYDEFNDKIVGATITEDGLIPFRIDAEGVYTEKLKVIQYNWATTLTITQLDGCILQKWTGTRWVDTTETPNEINFRMKSGVPDSETWYKHKKYIQLHQNGGSIEKFNGAGWDKIKKYPYIHAWKINDIFRSV